MINLDIRIGGSLSLGLYIAAGHKIAIGNGIAKPALSCITFINRATALLYAVIASLGTSRLSLIIHTLQGPVDHGLKLSSIIALSIVIGIVIL